jgi:hypothetical protein
VYSQKGVVGELDPLKLAKWVSIFGVDGREEDQAEFQGVRPPVVTPAAKRQRRQRIHENPAGELKRAKVEVLFLCLLSFVHIYVCSLSLCLCLHVDFFSFTCRTKMFP